MRKKALSVNYLRLLVPLLMLFVAACSTSQPSRYSIDQDHGPSAEVDLSAVADAVPGFELSSRGGNKSPYKVMGKEYSLLDSNEGYLERGIASWYGKKFHGHLTSNGEIYDMYAMSAAHKALQLPSFVRVTNLDNGKQVVVRVNDRGPFHGARLIDLSYAAAFKLDMLKEGTARVEIQIITVASQRPASNALLGAKVRKPQPKDRFIQVGAFSSWSSAQSVKTRVELLLRDQHVEVTKNTATPPLYRVRVGPVVDATQAGFDGVLEQLAAEGFATTQILDLP
ncbi:MAG: rare lipoprotein A [Motiliproteus sp.]|jgi:rare lipoprotein A